MQAATISVIGYGTWATALVHLITENGFILNWWVKQSEFKKHIFHHHHNPKYLSKVNLCIERINISNLLESVIQGGDLLIFAVPSAYLDSVLLQIKPAHLENKVIVSTIKGLEPRYKCTISQYFLRRFNVPKEQIIALGGPTHAEEVVAHLPTYITLAARRIEHSVLLSRFLTNENIRTIFTEDIEGLEIVGALKNVYAIGAGLAIGLGCNDNFVAVYVAAAHREMIRLLQKYYPYERDLNSSAYLGDLLVTVFSAHSRNRRLGYFIGQGMEIKQALAKLQMIAEGYTTVKIIFEIFNESELPIAQLIYKTLYRDYNIHYYIDKLKLFLE
jgi:glycerol-3-phosphate dehydrogenase (NAD(P)+)